MSAHLDEGRLLEARDGEGGADEEAVRHLEGCGACREALEALRRRGVAVASALASLDGEAWDVEEARARVRARAAEASASAAGGRPLGGSRRPRAAFWSLSRAAGLLLVTAAAASALPGSPVRAWLGQRFGGDEGASPAAPAAIEETPAARAAEATGVRLSVPSGPLRVLLQDARPGTDVRVLLVPGTEASVFAPAGSRFTSAAGRVEARLTPGEVRVELPTGVEPVSLEVGGRIYLRSTDAGLEVPGPVVTRTEDEILFRIPG